MPAHQVRHICKAHKADTQKPTLQKSLPCANALATLCGWTQTHIIDDREEGRTYNMGIAKMQADGSLVSTFVFQFSLISSLTLVIYL
ncbi:MAG: hypothetical protein JSS98_06610 [Bacteroidetes bacterium]|nr:hypothetical protein [Bacteroidota bacterium]